MQHNNWKKDRDILSEAYTTINSRDKDDEVLNELAPLVGAAARVAAPLIAKGAKAVAPHIAKGAKVAAQTAGAAVGNAVINKFSKDDEDVDGEASKSEDAESGGTVYIVQSDAEYEDTQVHGIFTDIETAKEHAAEVELPTGFWVGIKEMPLNKPEAQGKYHRLS